MEERYIIKACAFIINQKYPLSRKYGHGFWILTSIDMNGEEKEVATLHGLATSIKGEIQSVGYFCSKLKAYHIITDAEFAHKYHLPISSFRLSIDNSKTVYNGKKTLDIWFEMVAAITHINSLNLNYSPLGFCNLYSHPLNSNSIYRAFSKIGNLELVKFPDITYIGIDTKIRLNQTIKPKVKQL